jgi:hypothetical protein
MAVSFELPPKYSELRDLCHLGVSYQCTCNEVMLRSDLEDWLQRQNMQYECRYNFIYTGFVKRIVVTLVIDDDMAALQFKLKWL